MTVVFCVYYGRASVISWKSFSVIVEKWQSGSKRLCGRIVVDSWIITIYCVPSWGSWPFVWVWLEVLDRNNRSMLDVCCSLSVSHYNVGHDWPIGISLGRPIYFPIKSLPLFICSTIFGLFNMYFPHNSLKKWLSPS